MGEVDLSGAVHQKAEFKKTELVVGYGAHRGYFIGLFDKFTENTNFPCGACKGRRQIRDEECRKCSGTGKKSTEKVAIRYQLGKDLFQDEWVTYSLTEPGTLSDGSPRSASTLWVRMRAFSGGLTSEHDIMSWFANLPKPIKVPIEMIVTDNDAGTGCVIASVRRLNVAQQHAPDPEPEPLPAEDYALFGND